MVDRHEYQAAPVDRRSGLHEALAVIERIRGKHASVRSRRLLLVASDAGGAAFGRAEFQDTISSAADAARRLIEALQWRVSGRPRKRLPVLQDVSDPAATQSAAAVFGDHAQQV